MDGLWWRRLVAIVMANVSFVALFERVYTLWEQQHCEPIRRR